MQLQRLQISNFRNLRGLEINFATQLEPSAGSAPDAPPMRIRSHALIGQNGSGKSNLIEALIIIFRNIDLGLPAEFDYELDYNIRGHQIQIKAHLAEQSTPVVWVDGDKKAQNYLTENDPPKKQPRDERPRDERRGPRLLPSHVFAYYSGRNERMEALFRDHEHRFIRLMESTDDSGRKQREETKILRQFGDDRLRRLFYCRGGHSQLVLLACLLSDDPVFKKVLDNLNIVSLESALFVLKQPYRLRDLKDDDILEGDPRFWFARGTFVSEFLDKLWQVAWAPIQNVESKVVDFRGRREQQKQLFLYVPNKEKLKELGDLVGTASSFFRYAEAAYIGDLIDEVRITVKKRDAHGGNVSFTQLSEGELQILTVLGLMRITSDDHCLFLLDEPDTHLNPIWKLRYFDDIENVLAPRKGSMVQGESQILLTTHDPMMVGSLKREQVHILRREGNQTLVGSPDVHPQGMGVTGLLKSELFGLSSTLDFETERRLFRRNALYAMDVRTSAEDEEMRRLSSELADLGFSNADFKDPFYAMFVRKMAKHTRFHKPVLTQQEQVEQDAIADELVKEILREEGKL
ncbi:AAA family ATPase [Limnohabitans sp.]|jgi:predicted ATPase|uniref:AAA family ATPase n=1 Tax=Limnohabitans sp. TaxID=1907725 RepID=UPI0037BE8F16